MRSYFSISPWTDFNRMWDAMERYWPNREIEAAGAAFPIDIYERDGRIFIKASVPGVKADDLNVGLDQGVLTISGESRDDFEQRSGARMYQREHSYGRFVRSVRVPEDVDSDQIDAQFENGILTVSMPLNRPKPIQPKQIPIRTTSFGSQPGETGKESFAYADRPATEKKEKTEK